LFRQAALGPQQNFIDQRRIAHAAAPAPDAQQPKRGRPESLRECVPSRQREQHNRPDHSGERRDAANGNDITTGATAAFADAEATAALKKRWKHVPWLPMWFRASIWNEKMASRGASFRLRTQFFEAIACAQFAVFRNT
jgi:hypothetical protein